MTSFVARLKSLPGSKPSIQLSWITTSRNPSGVAASSSATAPTTHQRRRTAQCANAPKNFPLRDRSAIRRRVSTHFSGTSVSNAGITESDQQRQNITPMAVKMPKACTGPSGENANDRNPIAVVSDVFTTGHTISSIVRDTRSVRDAPGLSCSSAK